jgi:hypothetical protein
MNALKREIEVGEEVVVAQKHFGVKGAPIENRIFVCDGGFGMNHELRGSAVMGYWKSDGPEARDRIEGFMIDPRATRLWQQVKVLVEEGS